MFACHSPIDQRLLGNYEPTPAAELDDYLLRARHAQSIWQTFSVAERLHKLLPLTNQLVAQMDEICAAIVDITGKVKTEALLGEIYPVLAILDYYQKHAPAILAPKSVMTFPLSFPNTSAEYRYHPHGVVVVISPWNFPFQLTLYPLLTALIAGNSVIFKPSESSLPIGPLITGLLASLDLPEHLVQWVCGGPDSARELINRRPDLVFFTGGLEAGRQIMAAAAQFPIPVMLELGGKDAMLVLADAHIERAVNAAVYGAFSNSGQICVGIEKLYVHEKIFQDFVQALCAATARLNIGHETSADIGAVTTQRQIDHIRRQYEDAIAKGAQASGPLIINGHYVHPVVLWNVDESMEVCRRETFGPLLAVLAFNHGDDVVEQVNRSGYGLNASIWSTDIMQAQCVAGRLKVGNWVVNDVIKNVGHPRLPFGGVNNSGFGRYHGAEGLRSFSYTVSTMVCRSRFVKEPNWFPFSEHTYRNMRGFIDFLFGPGRLWQRARRNQDELRAFQPYASFNLRQHWHNLRIFLTRKDAS